MSEITANEHLSENIRVKLNEIEKISIKNSKNKMDSFLPENEYHDIGLLFAKLILKIDNHEVIYLGQMYLGNHYYNSKISLTYCFS